MDFQQIRKYVKGVLINSFLNKTTLDKLSTSNEGNLLFDGKELKNIGNIEASITELWSGQQSVSAEITLLDDYTNYDIIISMIEPLEDYPSQQKFDFMLKGAESLTGGMAENGSYIASYRLNNWNSTSVYFRRDNNPSGWNITLRKIWGIKFISQQHEYSTEEKIVGKWIDGKTIYEKVIIIDNPPSGVDALYEHGISNFNHLINMNVVYITNGGIEYSEPIFINSNSARSCAIDSTKLYITTIGGNYIQLYVTIQYTKTTD